MSVRIRQVKWWDLDVIAEADARIFEESSWTHGYYWAVLAQPGTQMFVAVDDEGSASETARSESVNRDNLAGWIVMSVGGGDADVMTIATTERVRGRGIGAQILRTGIDWARNHGANTIHLEVDSANAAALALYESFGFQQWGRRPDYYPGSDAVLMRHSAARPEGGITQP